MDRAQPGAIDSIVRNDELAQALGQFSDGWIVPGDDPTPAAQRREDVDDEALDGFDLSHSPTSLEVTVEPGEAFVDGWLLRDEPTEILLDADSTTDIVVGWNPDAIFNDEVDANRDEADETIVTTATNADPEHPTVAIWDVTTDGTGVVDVVDNRELGSAVNIVRAFVEEIDAGAVSADDAQVNNAPTEDTDVARKTEVDGKADTDANVEGFSTSGGADTVPVSQGDGTLQMEVVDTEIDLIEVQSAGELPDAENLDDPTIAYVNDGDDYVGVFQE